MTCTVLNWLPIFTNPKTVSILMDSLNHLIGNGMTLCAYVILENHMHLIAQSDTIGRDVARFKSYTAKKMIQFLHENKIYSILHQLEYYKKSIKAIAAINSGKKACTLNKFTATR